MEPFSRMKDILFGWDTDIHFENGDIKTTTGLDYIEREIYKLLITSPGDWTASPNLGASLEDFIGQNNSREVGRAIERHLVTNLSETVSPAQLSVTVVPTSETSLTVVIDIIIDGNIISRNPFQFDFVSGFKRITLQDIEAGDESVSSNNYQINDISQTSRPNKYYDRQRYQR